MNTIQQLSVIHSTFVIERSFSLPPERVFSAFADAAKKRRWFVESDHHEVEHFAMEFQVGGQESARFRFKNAPLEGISCTNDTTYQDILPNRRIIFASTMKLADRCISASLGTLEFLPSEAGTDLVFTHQGAFLEGADGPEMREAGWRKLFDRLSGELAPTRTHA